MTDSPSLQAPLDPKEEPILSKLLEYRDQLSLLKQDKSTYVKCGDVIPIYDEVIDQVHQLNTLRQEGGKPLESNRGLGTCFRIDEQHINRLSGPHLGRLLPANISILSHRWPEQRGPSCVGHSPIRDCVLTKPLAIQCPPP